MGEVTWKKFNGKTILYEDYRDANQNEIISLFEKANKLALSAKENSDVLVFANFQVSEITGEVFRSFKNKEAQEAAQVIKKSAIIGKPAILKQVTTFYEHFTNGTVKAFTTAEEALNWLTE